MNNPHWLLQPPKLAMASTLRPWLSERNSLTARLCACCQHFALRVVSEGVQSITEDERQQLGQENTIATHDSGITPRVRKAWVREVLLLADSKPVVFARSCVALPHLRGAWRLTTNIGTRPLGAALFANPRIKRGTLSMAYIHKRHSLHQRASLALGKSLPACWARRSQFLYANAPLLVCELFLPQIVTL